MCIRDSDQRCETEPSNSSSIRDECSFILDWDRWPAGSYYLDIFENGTIWNTLNLTVMQDYHEEAGPPYRILIQLGGFCGRGFEWNE